MSIKEYIEICKEYNISIEELAFAELLFLTDVDNSLIKNYLSLHNRFDINVMIPHLQQQGIIDKSYRFDNTKFIPENVILNKNFLNKYYKWSGELGEELWNEYPDFSCINGNHYTLKNIAKFYRSIDEFFYNYGKAIRFKPEKHKEVLEAIQWGKSENLIKENIGAFVINRGFDTLIKLRDSGFDGQNMTIDEWI